MEIMFIRKLLVGAIASTIACSSFAEDSGFSYTSIGLGYQTVEIVDEEFSGFGLSGSVALNETAFLIAGYSLIDSDDEYAADSGTDIIKITQYSAGIGLHAPISENVDIVTSFLHASSELEFSNISEDGNGYLINLALRGKPTDTIEVSGSINYANIEDEDDTGYSIGARLFLQPKVSLDLGYSIAEDVDAFFAGFSIDF